MIGVFCIPSSNSPDEIRPIPGRWAFHCLSVSGAQQSPCPLGFSCQGGCLPLHHRLRPDRKCSSTSPGTQEMWSLSITSRWKKEDQITWCTNKQSGPFFSFLGLCICLQTSCIFSNYYKLSYIRFNSCLWTIIEAKMITLLWSFCQEGLQQLVTWVVAWKGQLCTYCIYP